MICPKCQSGTEMAYNSLGSVFICLEAECGCELEIDPRDAEILLHPERDLTFA